MGTSLGLAAKLYYLTSGTRATWGTADSNGFNTGTAPVSLAEISKVQDLNWSATDGESDMSVRGNNGFEAILPNLTALELTFNMIYDPTDTAFLALMKAKINKSSIAAAALDAGSAVSGSIGVWADWHVLTTAKTEALREGQKVDFTLKPALTAVPPQYVKVT